MSSFILTYLLNNPSLRQNCPYSEFSLIWTECAEILHILMQKKKGKGSKVLTNNLLRSQAHEKKIQQKAPRICQYLRRVKTISKSQDRGTEH